jgi:hypothetical protein
VTDLISKNGHFPIKGCFKKPAFNLPAGFFQNLFVKKNATINLNI